MVDFLRTARVVLSAAFIIVSIALPAPCSRNGNQVLLEAVGTDQTGTGISSNSRGHTVTASVSSLASGTSTSANGTRIVVGPAKLGVVFETLPTPTPTEEDLLLMLLGELGPGAGADVNGDGFVDVADIITLLALQQ